MKIKKILKFIRQNIFYLAVSVISVAAVIAIFLLPSGTGNVSENPNPYANKVEAGGNKSGLDNAIDLNNNTNNELEDHDVVDSDSNNNDMDIISDSDDIEDEDTTDIELSDEDSSVDMSNQMSDDTTQSEEPQVQTETFESTTVSITEEPFFADGDKLSWPIKGEIVVPYTDDTTSYWYSNTFNYTMRTFGICISGEKDAEVVAAAKGRVTQIVDDSSTLFKSNIPYMGKTVILDHGNGYQTIYGFQGGSVLDDIEVGEIVNQGDVLGTIGSPKGAFVTEGENIYLQVKHNDEIVDPTEFLGTVSEDLKVESVDIGFAK